MPIYAYKCEACGFAKDVLQKVSDAPLSACPACGQLAFKKQVTAAGFQLKGSGWYVTDFKGGNAPAARGASTDASGNQNDQSNQADKGASGDKSAATPAGAGAAAGAGKTDVAKTQPTTPAAASGGGAGSGATATASSS